MTPSDAIGPLPAAQTAAFCLMLRPGCADEYQRRHDALWPDMRDALLAAGILHYEIHLLRETGHLFAFVVRRPDHTMASLPDNPVWQRWQIHMADLLVDAPVKPLRIPLERMFALR
jgi:L-rhamnose mutarotase